VLSTIFSTPIASSRVACSTDRTPPPYASGMNASDTMSPITSKFGSSTVVVGIDVKRHLRRHHVLTRCGTYDTRRSPVEWAAQAEELGAGELFVNSIDRDGTMAGYDLDLVHDVSCAVRIPVIAGGGAGSVADLGRAVRDGGASACAAGAFFVFHGPHRAVLISFPEQRELDAVFL
jgi:imidazole glycerol-phosphate synthase subunit HisF